MLLVRGTGKTSERWCIYWLLKVGQVSAGWKMGAGKVTFCRAHSMLRGLGVYTCMAPWGIQGLWVPCFWHFTWVGRNSGIWCLQRISEKKELCCRNSAHFFLSFEVMPSFPLGLDRIKLYSFYKLNELHFFKGKGSPRPWWWILYVNLTGPWDTQRVGQILFQGFLWGCFLNEINI